MRPGLPESRTAAPSLPFDVPSSSPSRLWQAVDAADRFVRLHFWGFTFFLVLLGVTSVEPNPSLGRLLLVMTVAALFHNFAYVLNDVVDLPVDRTHPARRGDFLVRGVIRPWQALVFALAQVPLAVGLSLWAGVGARGVAVLLLGFALMAIYDLWGKKCFCPPLTDLAQGLGWGCLVLYGALACGRTPSVLTWVAFASGAGFILLINGVHGGLRDLTNDLARGSRTTAIFFGSRPASGGVTLRRGLRIFALSVQLMLVVAVAVPLVGRAFGYSDRAWLAAVAVQGLLQGLSLAYMLKVFRTRSPSWGRDFRVHIFLLLLAPAVLFWPHMEGVTRWLFPAAFLGPFLLVEVTSEVIGRTIDRLRRLARA